MEEEELAMAISMSLLQEAENEINDSGMALESLT
jgi:hypothetical protein